ncbi:photosystem II reaction center W (PsbW) protein-related [Populus alba x Populus x berolinensis]|uniref:PSII 6.1 kDa protein n=1 Tax=Populus alba x Populus x berolinensis TaxID=444605 RepID=A0AAD6RCA4_9ROSI|nr:photosystem II reaction center W (PsbW) protein-related [Populus alba x Populus x berolinensis]
MDPGLPAIAKKGKVSCSMEGKPTVEEKSKGMSASMMAACGGAATISSPALALVDERLSTEGNRTSLWFEPTNFLFGSCWVVFGSHLVLSTLSTHSSLEEDEESGLSL